MGKLRRGAATTLRWLAVTIGDCAVVFFRAVDLKRLMTPRMRRLLARTLPLRRLVRVIDRKGISDAFIPSI
jgi:hypothetical protein